VNNELNEEEEGKEDSNKEKSKHDRIVEQ